MSKQKATELSETETTEEVKQSELEGLASTTEETAVTSEVVETKSVTSSKINTVSTKAVNGNKRMGVTRFLSYYPQNVYVETLLKFYYPKAIFTVDEWFAKIDEIMQKPIYN